MEQQVSGEEFRQMSVSSRSSQPNRRTVKIPVIWLAAVLVVGIACFLIGDSYGKSHAPKTLSTASSSASRNFPGGGFGATRGLRAFGSVSSVSSSSITINDQRTGSSAAYNITSSTQITDNGQSVSYTDIQTGDTVVITKASSSSNNASSIDVNPSFGGFPGGGSASPPSSSSSN